MCAFIGMQAQVEPVNGRNPMVELAAQISLDGTTDDEHDWADDTGFQEEDMPAQVREERDRVAARVRAQEAGSYDEAVAAEQPAAERARRRRMPPMPETPKGDPKAPVPFDVDEDGNVLGVPMAHEGDPPGLADEEDPAIAALPEGSAEKLQSMFIPPR